MNLYLVAFSVYALLITPVTLHVSVRVRHKVSYRVRVQAAGLPFIFKTGKDEPHKEQPLHGEDVARAIARPGWRPLLSALHMRRVATLLRAMKLRSVYVHVRFSFADAALTALSYAACRTVLETLVRCRALPGGLTGRVEMDFQAQGTEIFARGIIGARLGSIGFAAILLGASLLGAHGQKDEAKEETYAAASH